MCHDVPITYLHHSVHQGVGHADMLGIASVPGADVGGSIPLMHRVMKIMGAAPDGKASRLHRDIERVRFPRRPPVWNSVT